MCRANALDVVGVWPSRVSKAVTTLYLMASRYIIIRFVWKKKQTKTEPSLMNRYNSIAARARRKSIDAARHRAFVPIRYIRSRGVHATTRRIIIYCKTKKKKNSTITRVLYYNYFHTNSRTYYKNTLVFCFFFCFAGAQKGNPGASNSYIPKGTEPDRSTVEWATHGLPLRKPRERGWAALRENHNNNMFKRHPGHEPAAN